MKKNYWLILFALAVLLLGCRTESLTQEEPENANQPSNSTLKASLEEVVGKISKYDEELSQDIRTFTWKHKSENKYQGKTTEDNNYYFNTDDIQKITAENATYYTIPAVSKTDEQEDILHSLSLRVSDDGLQSRMITVRLKDDGNADIVSSVPYSFDPQSLLAREDVECTTYLVSGPCSCHTVHEVGGCVHPIQIMITQCGTASGAGAYGSYYTGDPSTPFSGNTSGVYVYGTADQVYNKLRILLKPDYMLTDVQKFKIMEFPDLASQIIAFLNQNPQHKAAAISFINSIGPISTAQEMQTAINNYINTFNFKTGLSVGQSNWIAQNPVLFDNILAYILQDYPNRKDFGYWGINFFIQNPTTTWNQFEYIINNKNIYENFTSIDVDNNTTGGYDMTTYDVFNPQQQSWSTIPNVIPLNDFVGWGYPGIKRNCMDYAKAQIAKRGYQISNYGAPGQTFQIYREQTGVNNTNLVAGLSYLKYALSNGIPVIVGIHDAPGHPGNADQSTDHFIVIVGMGSDSNGNFFTFYDNASGNASLGASSNNKLYYNSSTGLISGTSDTPYANGLIYILTQIRKSKIK